MADSQSKRSSYIPIVEYQANGGRQSISLPDWLSADYIDLHERVISYERHVVTDSDLSQPDGIAFKYYKEEGWWWLICSFNGIIDTFTDFYAGQVLRIPNLQQAALFLQKQDEVSGQDRIGQFVTI
jgi:hypothetical protein